MKPLTLLVLFLLPLFGFSQADSTQILIFRDTGPVKSVVSVKLDFGTGEKHKLKNKSWLSYASPQEKQTIIASLDKNHRKFTFSTTGQDTLFLEVVLGQAKGGILPSSKVSPSLRQISAARGRNLLKKMQ